jgi:hypothetical protein
VRAYAYKYLLVSPLDLPFYMFARPRSAGHVSKKHQGLLSCRGVERVRTKDIVSLVHIFSAIIRIGDLDCSLHCEVDLRI